VAFHAILTHVESLGFNRGKGTTLPSYASLAATEPLFLQDFYRYLTARRGGTIERETDRYPSYFGNGWVTPLHLGVLSSLQPDPTSPGYFDRFRRWHEQPRGPALQVGPWFGLNRDFDDFLAYLAAPFFALLAALMADVPGAARYLADQLGSVLAEVRADRLAVRGHISSWMLHTYSADPSAEPAFEELRGRVNAEGGLAERFVRQPYGGVPFAHLDPGTEAAFHARRVAVPSFNEFCTRFRTDIEPAARRADAARMAMRLLCSDETLVTFGEELLPLLHALPPDRSE
jgi:hypothetical protein